MEHGTELRQSSVAHHETEVRPVVYEVSVGVDGVRLREVLLDQPHYVRHLQLRLVHLVLHPAVRLPILLNSK